MLPVLVASLAVITNKIPLHSSQYFSLLVLRGLGKFKLLQKGFFSKKNPQNISC